MHTEILAVLLATGDDPAEIVHHAPEAGDDDAVADHALSAASQAAATRASSQVGMPADRSMRTSIAADGGE